MPRSRLSRVSGAGGIDGEYILELPEQAVLFGDRVPEIKTFLRRLEAGDLKEVVGKYVLISGDKISSGFDSAADAAEAADDANLVRPLIMFVGTSAEPLPAFKPVGIADAAAHSTRSITIEAEPAPSFSSAS
jgi:hypothetical protein